MEIRPFETLDEFEACVELQERVWGAGFSEKVPVAILKVSLRLGGIAAGAWDEDGELVGFVFGMTGIENGRVVHWSDMLAVRPGLRNAGLGTRLKAYQRQVLLERGIDRAYWTFDPLEARNAYLNFSKLGIVAREYQVNMYGETDSPLHRGIGTDRFVALWPVASERVRARVEEGARGPELRDVEAARRAFGVVEEGGVPVPASDEPEPEPDGRPLLVPIPARIQEVKERSPEAAARWRRATRAVFRTCLGEGYEARELLRGPGPERANYLLVPREDPR